MPEPLSVLPEKRIALIGYTSPFFLPFARALEAAGFTIFWVHSLRSFTQYLLSQGVPATQIVDLSDRSRFKPVSSGDLSELASLERADLPRLNDIYLMDRHLRTTPYDFALSYFVSCARALRKLVAEQRITCFVSGRDTALQITSLLVANERGIVWAGTTYMRLPNERFMLTATHHTDQVLPLGEVGPQQQHDAREYLQAFRGKALKPYVRASSTSWATVFRRFPQHVREALRLTRQAGWDRGNDFARYTLGDIARMYLRKKLYLLQATLFLRTHAGPSERPYVFFGLHRQPESSVDVLGSWFSNQPELIRTIARSIPVGYDLIVKLHVSDADGWSLGFYRALQALPAVRLVSATADSRALLCNAALTVTNSGTMAYEAGLLGLKAITFSRVHFNGLPTLRYCESPPALPGIVDELLNRPRRADDDANIESFLARMFGWSFAGLPNRSVFDEGLKSSDLTSLVDAHEALISYCQRRASGEKDVRSA